VETWVGLLMILSGPVALGIGIVLGGETGAILIMLGLIGSIWFSLLGYRLMRGFMTVGDLPGYFIAAAISLVGLAICSRQSS
jgi:hypothetical protein